MKASQQIKFGAILSYIGIGINIISGLLYTPWMIYSIGRENFGLYTLALSVISLFAFDFGLSAAVTRFIARYLAQRRQDKANNCIALVYRIYIFIDIVLFIILLSVFFFIPQIYRELTPDEIEKFKVIYSMAAVYAVISFPFIPVNGILTAHECFIQQKICDILHKLIIVGAMTVCLLLGYGLYALVLVNIISGILTILFKLWCIKHYTPQRISWNYFNKEEIKELTSYSGWVTIISLAQRLIFNIAPTILGALSGSTAIAILGIATTLEGYTYTFANALNGMFLPKVSRIVNDDGDILPLMTRIGRIQIFVLGLIISGFVCLGKDFIDLWVGEGFKQSYICAVLIILPSFFHLPQIIGNETIYAKNQVKKLAVVFVIMAACNLIGAILMAKPFGATGICISVFIAYAVRTIGMDIILYKNLGINISRFFKESFCSTALPILISLVCGFFISYFIPVTGWIGFLIKGCLFTFIYILIIYRYAMNKNEKSLVMSPMKRLLDHKNS